MIVTDNHVDCCFGGDGEYRIISNCEMTERGHEEDPRFGVCISQHETIYGTIWQTHEYCAEKNDRFYSGHYFMHDEIGAWRDYFKRCQEVVDYVEKWDDIKQGIEE